MRAQVLHRWGAEPVYEEVPAPSPGPGEVLVRVEACGVGLTVLNCMRGDLGHRPEDLPRIPGHEAVGVVAALGAGVETVEVGARVMAYFYLMCGSCDFCRLAHEPLCRRLRGFVGVSRNGGYAEYLALPAPNLLPVPDGVSPVDATVIPDAVATPYHVCRRAGVGPGDTVVVVGAGGGVGIHLLQMVRVFGGRAIAIDLSEEKLGAARGVGADAAFDFRTPDLANAVRAAAPSGPSVAVDLVGRRETLTFCLEVLERRGRAVLLTTFRGAGCDLSPREAVLREISILGCRYASRWEVLQAARLVGTRRVAPVVSTVVPLAEAAAIHARLREGTLMGRGAVAF